MIWWIWRGIAILGASCYLVAAILSFIEGNTSTAVINTLGGLTMAGVALVIIKWLD